MSAPPHATVLAQLGALRTAPNLPSHAVQTAEDDPVVSHKTMEGALEVLMNFAGSNFRKQSEVWSAALPNNPP